MKVYLSGPIYTDNTVEAKESTDKWREEVTELLQENVVNDIAIFTINPCRRKAFYNSELFTPNEIVFRDLKDIENADLILVNIKLLDNKLPIGTVMEVMYAWTLRKPIVIVSTDTRITKHPWLIAMSVKIFSDLGKACDYIVEFWT